ncbi:MAG: family 43 glycosylhydrolase [Acidobacteriaceae bacterium]|nr:family 43 glycosylhydrolase [Acidobacteriaceae bacterium]
MRKALWIFPLLLSSVVFAAGPSFHHTTVSNIEPRRDTKGQIIDAHDGCLMFFQGRYYLYGTAYGKSAGFGINNRFRVYSSADLEHWVFEGELLKAPPDGVYYRPYVAYNPKTAKYVVWYNWLPKLGDGKVGVAESDTPTGPFTIIAPAAHVAGAAESPGDGSLFVDNDGSGYFIYATVKSHHAIRIDRLTPDFHDSTGEGSPVLGTGSEAPAMFRNGSRYYVLFDTTCCFGPKGSGARVFVASSPLGPYTEKANINRGSDGEPIVPAQQTFVAALPTPSGTAYIWMGDRWGSRPDGIKGHDFQFWSAPLRFLDDGSIVPIRNDAAWSLSIERGRASRPPKQPYMWPLAKDSRSPEKDHCSGQPLGPEPR